MKHSVWTAVLVAILLLALGGAACAEAVPAAAQSETAEAGQGGAQTGTLRVWLKSLGSVKALSLTLSGSYTVEGNTGFRFERGTTVQVTAEGESLWLMCGGLSMNMGASLSLTRHDADEPNGVYIAGSAKNNLYCGSLELNVSGGVIQAVLIIDVEDYLYGVVPYEMNDAFPIEALKAQAVAARTYALRRRAERGSKNYDVVDTPADQVFYGYDESYVHAVAAVDATRGVCGIYQSEYAACYYTASNGGQTALAGDVLSVRADCGYLAIQDDPYDLENPSSPVSTVAFRKDASDAPDLLRQWLIDSAAEQLSAMGYSEEEGDISISRIESVVPHDTKYSQENRMYQFVTVSYTVDACPMVPVYAEPALEEKIYYAFTGKDYEPVLIGYETGEPETVDQVFACDISTYDQLKRQLGMKLSGLDCELTTVIEEEDIFIIQMRRYGHGVGMSQRGAQTMAGQYGKTYMDILAFYYPGLTFETRQLADETLPALDALPVSTARASEALLGPLQDGEYLAAVTLSNAWSTLNVRSAPSTDASILAALSGGAKVIVMSEADGWAHIRTGTLEGYVSSQYLTRE